MLKRSLSWNGCSENCVLHRCGVGTPHLSLFKKTQTKKIKHRKFGLHLYHPYVQPGGECAAILRPCGSG